MKKAYYADEFFLHDKQGNKNYSWSIKGIKINQSEKDIHWLEK